MKKIVDSLGSSVVVSSCPVALLVMVSALVVSMLERVSPQQAAAVVMGQVSRLHAMLAGQKVYSLLREVQRLRSMGYCVRASDDIC